jgi:hypothetical protein
MSCQKELKMIIKEYPENEDAYMKYWTLMKEINNVKELEDVSLKIQTVCNTKVPTNSWVEGIFKLSEMLVIKGEVEKAIRTLK